MHQQPSRMESSVKDLLLLLALEIDTPSKQQSLFALFGQQNRQFIFIFVEHVKFIAGRRHRPGAGNRQAHRVPTRWRADDILYSGKGNRLSCRFPLSQVKVSVDHNPIAEAPTSLKSKPSNFNQHN
ncbi:MAG TPA: hypothetical protein DEF79_05590 [Gammaproteobacteria bacterium]|nr:hypothetical protein [Gammaproteobacteria bacterium]